MTTDLVLSVWYPTGCSVDSSGPYRVIDMAKTGGAAVSVHGETANIPLPYQSGFWSASVRCATGCGRLVEFAFLSFPTSLLRDAFGSRCDLCKMIADGDCQPTLVPAPDFQAIREKFYAGLKGWGMER